MIRLTIRQMQYFESLYDALHFGRAAELAGVTQPALSAQIAEMEDRLGCKLFERGGKLVRPTEEARLMRPRIERILRDIRDVETLARRGRVAMEGRFRLGIIPTVAPYILPRALPELKERFPALSLEIRETITSVLVEETAAGRLDGAIAALPVDHPSLVAETLFDDRFFLAVPPGDPAFESPPVPPESPELERLMLLEEGHCMREQALAVCGSIRPAAMASYGATSLTTLLQMVAHGLGVTLIPEIAAKVGGGAGLQIVPFAEPAPKRTLCLAFRRNSPRREECATLAALIRKLWDAPSSEEMDREQHPQERQHRQSGAEAVAAIEKPVGGHMDESVHAAQKHE